MPRTRKHKYKRKICNSRRSIAMNKRKMKTKTKTKTKPRSRRGGGGMRKIFKKSHKRYAMKGMKRRIQRGGGVKDDIKKLMEAYKSIQTRERIYKVTLNALNSLQLSRSELGIECFQELILLRRGFGLTYLPLEDILLFPKLYLIIESLFSVEETRKHIGDQNILIRRALEHWTDFITQTYALLHPDIPNIDEGDIDLLKIKQGLVKSKMDAEQNRELKDMYASLLVEIIAIIKANKGAPPEREPTNFFELAPPPVKPVVYEVKDYISRYGYQSIDVTDDPLDKERFTYPVKEYLTYRLSHGRTGASDKHPSEFKTFKKKIVFISRILDNRYTTNQGLVRLTGIDGYDGATIGKKLLLLLRWLDLIPVFGEGADEYGKYDYVPDPTCKVSAISGSEFTLLKRKSHCRTCGRCMHKEETRDEEGYKVCINCYNLFSGVLPPGPGGSAASAAQ